MNWTHRRPFRHQFNYGGAMNKINRPVPSRLPKMICDQPIDAIHLQLADYETSVEPCPIRDRSHREHPYLTTFSDHQSSVRRTRSSIHSISTIETDFVHQRVSTIHTYPSSPSIVERQQIIDEIHNDDKDINSTNNPNHLIQQQIDEQSFCRTCSMLIEIVDQQAQLIQQYTQQISQQTDLLAKLARRLAGIDEQPTQSSNTT